MAEKLDPQLNELYAESMYMIQKNAIRTLPSYANGLKKIIKAFIANKPSKKNNAVGAVSAKEFLKAGEQLLEILPISNRNIVRDTSNDANTTEEIVEELKKYGVEVEVKEDGEN